MTNMRFYARNKKTGKYLSIKAIILGHEIYDEVEFKSNASQCYHRDQMERMVSKQETPDDYEIVEMEKN